MNVPSFSKMDRLNMSEIWKDVIKYEGIYVVSDSGRVKRIAAGMGAIAGRILKPRFDTCGYNKVVLYKSGISRLTTCWAT